MIRWDPRSRQPHTRPPIVEGEIIDIVVGKALPAISPVQRYYKRRLRQRLRTCLALGIAVAINVVVLGYIFLWSRATVIIVPATTVRTANVSVIASAHPAHEESRLVQHEALASSPFMPAQATGTRHIPATVAVGPLTWFNQESYPQMVSAASTSITVSPTLQIAPDHDVIVPASTGSAPGEVPAPAHAVQAGSAGNIVAGTINMLCSCGAAQGIVVKNLTGFSGGQDAETRQFIQPSDLTQAVASQVLPTLHHAQHLLQQQVKNSEQVIGASTCASRITTDQPLAGPASVRASIVETCALVAFDQQDVRQKAIGLFLRSVSPPGPHQVLNAILASRRVQVTTDTGAQSPPLLSVRVTAQWRYEMDRADEEKLQRLLVSKTQDQAALVLTHYTGVGTSSIAQLIPWLALPGDAGRISIRFVSPSPPRDT